MNQFSTRDRVFYFKLEQIKNLMLYLEKVNVLWEEEKRNVDEKYKVLKDENYEHWDSVFADYEDEYHVYVLFTINLKHSIYITAWMNFENMSRKIYEDIARKKGENKSFIKKNTKSIDTLIKHLKSKPWKEVIVEEDLIDDIDRYKKVRNNIIHNNGQAQQEDLKKAEYKDIVIKSYRMDFDSEYLHKYVESICSFLEQMNAYKKI